MCGFVCCSCQTNEDEFDVVPSSHFVVSRTAFKDNSSYYKVSFLFNDFPNFSLGIDYVSVEHDCVVDCISIKKVLEVKCDIFIITSRYVADGFLSLVTSLCR
jgi:hypothetical protein